MTEKRTITPGTHLDHWIRQTRIHHMQLSSMADVKANMMLTLASLIITFSIGYLSDPVLRWPVVTMICFCALTIFSAAYAVMPKLDFSFRPDLKDPKHNILFFGTFLNLSYEEYLDVMTDVADDPTRVYETQIREVYELGQYLGRKKYRYIRLAYRSFLTGLVVSMLVLLIVEGVHISW